MSDYNELHSLKRPKENALTTFGGRYKLKTPKSLKKVVETYKKIENGVVDAYKAIENGAVGAYKKIEDKFVDKFLEKIENNGTQS